MRYGIGMLFFIAKFGVVISKKDILFQKKYQILSEMEYDFSMKEIILYLICLNLRKNINCNR